AASAIRASTSGTTRTSIRRIPWACSQLATWAMFLSCVRPERISSPITTSAAVQMRSAEDINAALGQFAGARHGAFEAQDSVIDRTPAEIPAVLEVVLVEPPRQPG